jgi:hypothetical protein
MLILSTSWLCWTGSVLCSARLDSVSIHQEFCFLVINNYPAVGRRTLRRKSGERKRLAATLVATALLQQRHEQKWLSYPTMNLVSDLSYGRIFTVIILVLLQHGTGGSVRTYVKKVSNLLISFTISLDIEMMK